MAKRQEPNTTVYSPDEGEPVVHTPDNARDLVQHAGWTYNDPNAVPDDIKEELEALKAQVNSGKSFDETEAEEETPAKEAKPEVKVEAKKEAAKPAKPKK